LLDDLSDGLPIGGIRRLQDRHRHSVFGDDDPLSFGDTLQELGKMGFRLGSAYGFHRYLHLNQSNTRFKILTKKNKSFPPGEMGLFLMAI
jgi:hypothetical protein